MKKLNILVLLILLVVSVGLLVGGVLLRDKKNKYTVSTQMTNIVGVPTGNNSWVYTGTVNNCKGVQLSGTSNLGGPNPKDMSVWIPVGTSCPTDAVLHKDDNKTVSIALLSIGGVFGLCAVIVFFMSMGKKMKGPRRGIEINKL